MALNLNHLAVFRAVAAAGSVSGGAVGLMVSQPAVSKQLKELEKALRVSLFDRHAKGVRLTDAGVALADYARRIFDLADEAESALDDLSALRRGDLRVGASPTLGTYLLPAALVYFRQRFPGVRLRLEVGNAHLLRRALADGDTNLVLTEAEVRWPECESRVLFQDELVPVVHPGHALARRRKVTAEALCREPFVVREAGSESRSLAERALAEAGHVVEPVLSLGSTEAVKQAVVAGLGVAVVSRLAVAGEVADGRLAVLRVEGLSLRRPVRLFTLAGKTPPKASHAFACILRHAARGSLPRRAVARTGAG